MVKWMGWPSKFNSWIPTSATAALAVEAVVVVAVVVVAVVVVAAVVVVEAVAVVALVAVVAVVALVAAAVVVPVDIHDASLTTTDWNILLVDVEIAAEP